jgi:catechol 2,3-dioxygenase-like lactoylglutathione lyase family enzyme
MPNRMFHHSGLWVSDIDRAARFYVDAFEGRLMHKPVQQDPETSQAVMGTAPGVAFKFVYIAFENGAVELFEFVGEGAPEWAPGPVPGRVPHFAMDCDDVERTVERVVAAGGDHLWDEVADWGGSKVTFVADPDGNAIELLSAPVERIAEMTVEMFPESRV